jgi:predicted metal-dependent hydrolase
MKAKWGIYDQASDSYILNTDLVKAPIRCIDYVILHEVVHSRHLDHGKKFYTLMDKLMPDWREWKERMEKLLS